MPRPTRKHDEALRKADVTRAALPFYLGDEVSIRDTELSPDARWLMVVTEPKSHAKGREGQLTRYVTESGYEEFEKERLRVGRNPPAPQSLVLLNLVDHTVHALAIDKLPGIYDDPLKAVREENAKAHPRQIRRAAEQRSARQKPRGVWRSTTNRTPERRDGLERRRRRPRHRDCIRSTTRIAGSPAWIWTSTCWCRSTD